MSIRNESEVENQSNQDNQLSSFELMWKAAFEEVDEWAGRLNHHDDLFLNATKQYVESIKRNQENSNAITEQFKKELLEWEKYAREELLMTTTTIQHFFPVKSYEEINQVVDDIQNKTTSLLSTPIRSLTNGQALDKYLDSVQQYISFRKKGREKYIEGVKSTTNVLYENQKIFVNLFENQVKSALLPFQQYMKTTTESNKS
jgi:flagellar biosynthesis/type III secretory pathway chaperone